MPAYYDLPGIFNQANEEDRERFEKLPFYLVKSEIKQFPRWNIYDQLYGKIDWEPNMGNVMRAVSGQPSPVGETFFFPANVTEAPRKNEYQVTESKEEARVKWHRYESFQFNFLPAFNTFWRDHISYQHKDITRQIQVSNNTFIRTNMWYMSPYVYIAGVGLTASPTEMGNSAGTAANSKTTAWVQGAIAQLKCNATLRTIYRAGLAHREDIGAPPFEGVGNMPKANEGMRDKYCFVGSTEAWDWFPFDADTHLLKNINLDLLFNDFNGLLFGRYTYKFDPFPIRFKADGTPVPPQITLQVAAPSGGTLGYKCIPNPDYTDPAVAIAEVMWCCGGESYRSVKVGPPPSEFASQSMKAEKFYSLRWNGEVQLTDQILLKDQAGNYELNRYGTQLQFISQLTHGIIGVEPRYTFPILFLRKRAPEIA